MSIGDTRSTNGYLWVNIRALGFGVQVQNKERRGNNKEECKTIKEGKKDEKQEMTKRIKAILVAHG